MVFAIIATFVAIFFAAALFVGPEIALARARVLGRWTLGATILAGVLVCLIGFGVFVVVGLTHMVQHFIIDPLSTLVELGILAISVAIGYMLRRRRSKLAK